MMLLLIEDDEMTREMLAMLLEADGWSVRAVDSGEAALRVTEKVDVVLSDLNLHGIGGEALAAKLAERFTTARLLGMTATKGREAIAGFERVLLKPVDVAAVRAALKKPGPDAVEEAETGDDLSAAMYDKLMAQMPAARVLEFYAFALHDAEKRVATLRALMAANEDAAFRSEAHALKGGCAMVGALRLSQLAGAMELEGIKHGTARQLEVFVAGMERVRRILAEREKE